MDDTERLRRIVAGCNLDAALEAVGERWSFLILRAAFNGARHFEQFQAVLGIARNVLAARLTRLTGHGILEREPCADDRRKVEYRLTEKGEALLPVIVALRQWGDRWGECAPHPGRLVDDRDLKPIAQLRITAHDGRALRMGDMHWEPAED